MNTPEAVRPLHLARLAIVYIRQSSPHQALHNQESLRLQYDLRQHALAAGWDPSHIRVIDTDLGRTARSAQDRPGFQELVTLVNQEQVGVIFAYEVTRLARNCTDWYQLLDLCGFRSCLVGDQEGIYDPTTPNGRLILGLKGLISELELNTLRIRLTAGLLNKARRGELALALPIGLVRDALGRVSKHPNQEVQDRLALVFATFLRRRSACRVVEDFNDNHLLLPRRDRFGEVAWRRPTTSAVLSVLKNPAYAGAFVYGRTRTVTRPASGRPQQKALPLEQWKVCLHDRYPAYIDWATFERIQAMIRDNHSEYERNRTRGIPRAGKALLHGLVCCGECGHQLVVQYKGGTRYVCNYLRQQCRVPVCQYLPADPIDAHVVAAFLKALSAAELDLYDRAVAAIRRDDEQVRQAQQQQLQRLRYQAQLAERQFHQADPDNRLVTAELERRWEVALRELKEAEERFERLPLPRGEVQTLSEEEREAFLRAGRELPQLWRDGRLSPQHQKAFLRCLVEKVITRRVTPDTLEIRIIWKGGDTTTARLTVTVGSLARRSGFAEMEKEILELFRKGKSDEEIATLLSARGYRSPKAEAVLPSTVRILRLRHGLLRERRQSHPRHIPGSLTIPQLARDLGITAHWIYDRIHNGTIQIARDAETNLYLFPDQPQTLALFRQLRAGTLQQLHF